MPSMNIIVTSLKGGVGKSTSSIYLCAAAVERGYDPVTLIDADPQASSAEWLETWPLPGITVVEAPSERTATRAMGRVDGLAIVDTPPGNERVGIAAGPEARLSPEGLEGYDAVLRRAMRGWN